MEEIRSLQHPLVKRLRKLRQSRKARQEEGQVLIFGRHMVYEVCMEQRASCLLTTDNQALPDGLLPPKKIYRVTPEILAKIAGVQSADSLLAEVSRPTEADLSLCHRVLVLDGVSDPGNLGTLLRSGLALGWDGAYLLDGSVDPFNDKALRASKGAVFRFPLKEGGVKELLELTTYHGFTLWTADVKGEKAESLPAPNKLLLALGSEAQGLRAELKEVSQSISIPLMGSMESLNVAVAGGILLYLLAKGGQGV